MEKVTFSLTFKEKERKNIYEKEEILFFASKCPTDPWPQQTSHKPHKTHKCMYTSFPDKHPIDLNDPQILKESPFLFEKRKNLFEN